MLRGGTADVATDFGAKAASIADGGFTNLGNIHVPTLPTSEVTSSISGVSVRTVSDAISVNVSEFNGFWEGLSPANVRLTTRGVDDATQVATSFLNEVFTPKVLLEDKVFYRIYGLWETPPVEGWVGASMRGRFLSEVQFSSAAEAREFLALKGEFNAATRIAEARVPRGTVIWEGRAAPQPSDLLTLHTYPGGGSQIFLSHEELLKATFTDLGLLGP